MLCAPQHTSISGLSKQLLTPTPFLSDYISSPASRILTTTFSILSQSTPSHTPTASPTPSPSPSPQSQLLPPFTARTPYSAYSGPCPEPAQQFFFIHIEPPSTHLSHSNYAVDPVIDQNQRYKPLDPPRLRPISHTSAAHNSLTQ